MMIAVLAIYEDADRIGESICVVDVLWGLVMRVAVQFKNTLVCSNGS